MVQSVETSNDMSHLQLLLCIFQQGDEGPLGAFGQLVGGHTDVQPVLPKHGFPVGTGAPQTCSRKSDLCGLVLPPFPRPDPDIFSFLSSCLLF